MTSEFKNKGPWFDGIRANIDHGSKGNDNPYIKETPEYKEWNDGWEEAAFYGGYGFYGAFEKESK